MTRPPRMIEFSGIAVLNGDRMPAPRWPSGTCRRPLSRGPKAPFAGRASGWGWRPEASFPASASVLKKTMLAAGARPRARGRCGRPCSACSCKQWRGSRCHSRRSATCSRRLGDHVELRHRNSSVRVTQPGSPHRNRRGRRGRVPSGRGATSLDASESPGDAQEERHADRYAVSRLRRSRGCGSSSMSGADLVHARQGMQDRGF
jgi:hypothetical protein